MSQHPTRPMRHEDASTLSEAFAAIGWTRPAERFLQYVEQHESGRRWVRVAECDGELAGYVTILWQSDDPVFRDTGTPEILDLNVLPAFRRRGVARALLDEAEREVAKRSDVVGLRVGLHAGYGAAQRIYAKRGYVPDGTGALHHGGAVEEGAWIRLDDDVTLRMTKPLERLSIDGRDRSGRDESTGRSR